MKNAKLLLLALAVTTLSACGGRTAPTSPTAPRVVLGTTQQDGAPAKLGETFTLGKASPLNFTLLKAEYSVGRVVIGNTVYYPQVGEKLLVLHDTVHNPQKKDVRYYWADLKFAAVDAQDRTHEFVQAVAREGTTERLELSLKPAQKVQAMTVIRVPASGVVPKLMVQREAALLRYDLRGQVTPLAKGIADPADVGGATPRSQVPTALKTFSSLERFDVRLDEVGFTKPPRRWVMVTPRGGKSVRGHPTTSAANQFAVRVVDAVVDAGEVPPFAQRAFLEGSPPGGPGRKVPGLMPDAQDVHPSRRRRGDSRGKFGFLGHSSSLPRTVANPG